MRLPPTLTLVALLSTAACDAWTAPTVPPPGDTCRVDVTDAVLRAEVDLVQLEQYTTWYIEKRYSACEEAFEDSASELLVCSKKVAAKAGELEVLYDTAMQALFYYWQTRERGHPYVDSANKVQEAVAKLRRAVFEV